MARRSIWVTSVGGVDSPPAVPVMRIRWDTLDLDGRVTARARICGTAWAEDANTGTPATDCRSPAPHNIAIAALPYPESTRQLPPARPSAAVRPASWT